MVFSNDMSNDKLEFGKLFIPGNAFEIFMWVILDYHGKPYTWGGDDPMAGFDCSGHAIAGLKSAGRIPRKMDYSADGLWHIFFRSLPPIAQSPLVSIPMPGNLAFWFDNQRTAVHVAVCLNHEFYIGAEGGGKFVKTLDDAIKHNAFIKIRPLSSRPGAKFVNIWP